VAGANKSRKTSRYVGVSFHRMTGKWRVHLGRTYIGIFADEETAAQAYDDAAIAKHGADCARLNFLPEPNLEIGERAIKLTHGRWAIVDAADYDFLDQWTWSVCGNGYVERVDPDDGSVKMHVTLFGDAGHGRFVDHKNRNRLDNRRSNLRAATRSQNGANRTKATGKSSVYKGVSYAKARGLWIAEIRVNGRALRIGAFVSEVDAAMAYDAAARAHFGEFAAPNFDSAAA
jgi:hypothetical protein